MFDTLFIFAVNCFRHISFEGHKDGETYTMKILMMLALHQTSLG
jgi:hypothetical protein